jgi:hypothetical protein
LIGRVEQYVGKYDFASTEEDILKELYQGLVDPVERHDLGEYYTPDWLAELTLDRLGYQGGSLLDPSCGSGTFLMSAIRRLRVAGLAKGDLVEAVSRDLAGIDVHPLAVLMAKANLLLALGHDARGYKGQIRLPIFMADTLQTELDETRGYLKIPAAKNLHFHLPLATIEHHPDQLDGMIEEMNRFAHSVAESQAEMESVKQGFLKKFSFLLENSNGESFYWKQNIETAAKLIRQKRNSIWSFVLKNTYRPTFLRRQKVDYIVGNPPWLSYRYIQDDDYKERIRSLCFEYGLLDRNQRALITQIELATVFYRHCERHFLKAGGKIGMVLPWGAMGGAKQHEKFQQQGGFAHAMDFHEVTGLFNVPCCVLIGPSAAGAAKPKCEYFKGTMDERNPGWKRVKDRLKRRESPLVFVTHGIRSPWYHEKALQGATIVPRSLFFVERDPDCADVPEAPYLRTSEEAKAEAKEPWKKREVAVNGQIESKYLYYTVLSKGLLPFGISRVELVFLPIFKDSRGYPQLRDMNELLSEGHISAATWLAKSMKLWDKYSKNDSTLLDWLNYNQKLTKQNLKTKYLVLYNRSGTNLTAAMHQAGQFRKQRGIALAGFVADSSTYKIETDSLAHADYLCSVLNSETVMEAIKETMTKGLMGERDIHRRPFEACAIPLFDPKNDLHQSLATLGEICRKKSAHLAPKIGGALGKARSTMRALLAEELHEIDKLTAKLLEGNHGRLAKPVKFSDDDEPSLF